MCEKAVAGKESLLELRGVMRPGVPEQFVKDHNVYSLEKSTA